jgi:20S proteasome subunit alpha 7
LYQGYNGAAVGKGRQLAKTELEKLKLSELSTREAAIEAARMCVFCMYAADLISQRCIINSIYLVHDDAKEKDFELEMSWIGDETNGLHLPVPKDLMEEAQAKAKAALETFD